jgi:Integrase core domain
LPEPNPVIMNAYLSKLMTYHQVHQLYREGFSISYISNYLSLNWRTVKHLLSISTDGDYEHFLQQGISRNKLLLRFEGFVKGKLVQYPDTSSAQMHDWLKEHFEDFPTVCPKTVFNFVAAVRQKHHLPRPETVRDCTLVEELPFGRQAQADFGECSLRDGHGKRTKVYFFTLVLSRSRYKFVWLSAGRFTTHTAIEAHEKAFAFIGGIPEVMVYDQDRVFMVDENKGDLILTEGFKVYVRERGFKLHFCRKADPQSKGKVENVVKYVKQNFLYNRSYHDIDMLNAEALAWLARTANQMNHGGTKKKPAQQWEEERLYLREFIPLAQPPAAPLFYTVRKDNSISFQGNFYSLPLGTFKGRGSKVAVVPEEKHLLIYDEGKRLLCRHELSCGKGQRVINNNHKREKESTIGQLIQQVGSLFEDADKGLQFIEAIHKDKPRYIRDQLLSLRETIKGAEKAAVEQALACCLEYHSRSASDFKSLVQHYSRLQGPGQDNTVSINPLNGKLPEAALIQPQTSSINDYDMF